MSIELRGLYNGEQSILRWDRDRRELTFVSAATGDVLISLPATSVTGVRRDGLLLHLGHRTVQLEPSHEAPADVIAAELMSAGAKADRPSSPPAAAVPSPSGRARQTPPPGHVTPGPARASITSSDLPTQSRIQSDASYRASRYAVVVEALAGLFGLLGLAAAVGALFDEDLFTGPDRWVVVSLGAGAVLQATTLMMIAAYVSSRTNRE